MKEDSQYLDDDQVIPLHKALAKTFGVTQALIIQQVRYWMTNHRKSEGDLPESHRRHYHQERWWIWNTYEQWKEAHFDFWSERTIQRNILQLERKRVMLAGQFNRRAGDRTKWYSLDFDRLDWLVGLYTGKHRLIPLYRPSCQSGTMPSCQNGTMVVPKWHYVMTTKWHGGRAVLSRPLPKTFFKEIDEQMMGDSLDFGVWQTALYELQLQLPRETFDTWLRNARLLAVNGDCWLIGVHNVYAREWLDQRLKKVIERTLSRLVGEKVDVQFEVAA